MGGSNSHDYEVQLNNWSGQKFTKITTTPANPKNETGAIRHYKYTDSLVDFPLLKDGTKCKNIWSAFQNGRGKKGDNGECYGYRPFILTKDKKSYERDKLKAPIRGEFEFLSYKQVNDMVLEFAHGLKELGAQKDDVIGIYCTNRPEWMITALACWSQGYRIASLYATLGENAIEYIANHSQAKFIVVSKDNMKKMIGVLPRVDSTKYIIQTDFQPWFNNIEETVLSNTDSPIKIIGFSEVLKKGQQKNEAERTVEDIPSDSVAYIMYTSGTTGVPKGVILTHANFLSVVVGLDSTVKFEPHFRYISYLPLAHSFEAIAEVAMIYNGVAVGFFQGNIKLIAEDLLKLKPHVQAGVPRVFGRFHSKIFAGVNGGSIIKKWLFHYFYNKQCVQTRSSKFDPTADKLMGKIRQKIGWDNMRIIVTGAAPCPPHLLEFIKVIVGPNGHVFQGYGLTECCAGSALTCDEDPTVGHTGFPMPQNEFKLVSVPEMNYLANAKKPTGELCIRGNNLFSGYHNNDKATEEVFDEDKWFHTGDIACLNPTGSISIIDRKKNIFKLSQGEYIAAESLENQYSKSSVIWQIWVYGNSMKSFLLGVVVPNAAEVANFAKEKWEWKIDPLPGSEEFIKPYADMVKEHYDEIKAWVLQQIEPISNKLAGYERLRDIVIEYHIDNTLMGFTEVEELITPTQKLKRVNLLRKYIKPLKELYGKCGEPVASGEKWPGE